MRTYTSFGSVEGHLDAVNFHRHPYFTVYDVLTDEPIRCHLGELDRDEVLAAVGKRVLVGGELRHRDDHKIVSVRADRLEVFPSDSELPTWWDVRGILA